MFRTITSILLFVALVGGQRRDRSEVLCSFRGSQESPRRRDSLQESTNEDNNSDELLSACACHTS